MDHRAALVVVLLLAPAFAQEAPPPPQKKADPLVYVQAPGRLVLGKDVAVGWHATQRATQGTGANSQTLVTRWAIVGETAETWRVEHVSFQLQTTPELVGTVMGLVVRKKDGAVNAAVVGKPGEKGSPVRITPPQDAGQPEQVAEEKVETVTLAGKPYRARKESHPKLGQATWVGMEGPVQGVPIKFEGGASWELAAAPESVALAEGRKAVRLRFSNGMEWDLVEDPLVAAFFPVPDGPPGRGLFATRAPGMELLVTETGKDAKPTLKWE